MKRREFITLLGGAAVAWPLTVRAQQTAMPVIGFLNTRGPAEDVRLVVAFRQGLKETGYVEGLNVRIEYRWAEGHIDRLPGLAADLVRGQVTVIAANSQATVAAKGATSTIPIVFITGADPVQVGFVASLHRPGGNLTGVASLDTEMAPKRLQMLHELLPNAGTIAALVNPTFPGSDVQTKDLQEAGSALGLRLHVLHASTAADIDKVIANVVRLQANGLVIANDPFFSSWSEQLGALALRHRVRDLPVSSVRRGRRIDELRKQHYRLIPSSWQLCWTHPERRKASRAAGPAGDESRVDHQSQDRERTRPNRTDRAACPCRRGDRITRLFCCGCSKPLLAQSDVSLRRTGSVALGGIADIGRTSPSCRCEAIDPKRTLTALKSRSAAALCPYCERLTLGLRVGTTPERGTPEQINGSK